MTDRTGPPFRADHVGSLLRPPELLHAREEHAAGRITAERLRAVEDDAIREAVRRQEGIGLGLATDGDFRRSSWYLDFLFGLDGVGQGDRLTRVPATGERGAVEYLAPSFRIDRRVGLAETIFGEDFAFLRSTVTSATPKLTIPSPSMLVAPRREPLPEHLYPDPEQFALDVSAAYAEEIRRLAELGCTYLQIDDTTFAFANDPRLRELMGGERGHETNVRNLNRALAGRPAGTTVAVHACRGNYRSAWFSEGGYDYVAEVVFGGLEVDGFFLEYDDARSGGFEPLRFVAPGRFVILGLVTTKRGELESKDDLKRRVEEASRFVPMDRLGLSPQCGFASTVEGNTLTEEQQWAKLRLVVETAAEIWGDDR